MRLENPITRLSDKHLTVFKDPHCLLNAFQNFWSTESSVKRFPTTITQFSFRFGKLANKKGHRQRRLTVTKKQSLLLCHALRFVARWSLCYIETLRDSLSSVCVCVGGGGGGAILLVIILLPNVDRGMSFPVGDFPARKAAPSWLIRRKICSINSYIINRIFFRVSPSYSQL